MKDRLLKTDARSRVITPLEHREALLDLFEASTATAKAFAAEHGIKYPTFYSWLLKRRSSAATSSRSQAVAIDRSRFVEAIFAGPPAGLSIELPGAARLALRSAAEVPLAAELIAALARHGISSSPAASC
jgi:hypothetical protein